MAASTQWPKRLIVVDQGRRETVHELLHELERRGLDTLWVPSTATGRSSGLNEGLERVTTRFVAITDDDCLVEPDWLEGMLRWLRREPGSIVTGRVEAGEGEVVLAVETSRLPSVQERPSIRFDRMVGGNMGLAMEIVGRIGYFEEDSCIRNAEDQEYAYRALRAGTRIIYAPEVAVRHLGWREEQERVAQYRGYARSHGGFYGKYLRRRDLFIAARASFHFLRSLKRWMMGTLRGNEEQAHYGRAYALGLLPGIVAGWRSESRG